MEISIDKENMAEIVVNVDGRLDLLTTELFNEKLEQILSELPLVIILNCKKLSMISSVGIKELIKLKQKATKEGITVKISEINKKIESILKTMGLMDFFELENN